ncbi:MAG: hypothetical protein ACRC42_04305 [Mycoplasma sp.]
MNNDKIKTILEQTPKKYQTIINKKKQNIIVYSIYAWLLISIAILFTGLFIGPDNGSIWFLLAGAISSFVGGIVFYIFSFMHKKAVNYYDSIFTLDNLYSDSLKTEGVITTDIVVDNSGSKYIWKYHEEFLKRRFTDWAFSKNFDIRNLMSGDKKIVLSYANIEYFKNKLESKKKMKGLNTLFFFDISNDDEMFITKKDKYNLDKIDIWSKQDNEELDIYFETKPKNHSKYIRLAKELLNSGLDFDIKIKGNKVLINILFPLDQFMVSFSNFKKDNLDEQKIISKYTDDLNVLILLIKSIQSLQK